jgi:DNA-binding CsgD family transcriptional regulator
MSARADAALLERAAELTALTAALDESRRGVGRLVVIEASAGIGKTRLLQQACDSADRAGMRVLMARGGELEREFPFALVRQLFESELVGTPPAEREQLLAGSAGPAGPVVGVAGPPADNGSLADPTFATLNALYWLTSNLAEARPTLLAVDDAHWSDAPSLRFFRFLVPRLADLRAALVIAARPAEGEADLLPGLISDSAASVLRPRELSRTAVAELVRGALAIHAHDDFCVACHAVSGGNPFMLRELLVELAAGGIRGTAAEAARVREVAPATIRRAVLLRLARLPDPASRLASAVAVLGDQVSLADAAELARLDRAAAAAAGDALAAADVLKPGRPLRFVHPLVRAAVYADMSGSARSAAHRQAARLLSERGAVPERIAVHLVATDPAGDPAVVDTLTAAARRALDHAAPETAIGYLRRAQAEQPARDLRLDVLRLLVRAYFQAGDRAGFDELLDSGQLAELIAEPRRLLACAAELGHALYSWDRVEEMEALLERAAALATEVAEYDLAARFQALLAYWTHQVPGEVVRRLDRLQDRIEPDTPGERVYLALRAYFGLLTGEPRARVLELAHRALEGGKISREHQDAPIPFLAIYSLCYAGDLDGAELALARHFAIAGSLGLTGVFSQGGLGGELSLRRGQVADAEAEARLAVELHRQAGYPLAYPVLLAVLVEVLIERDDLAGAEAELAASGLATAIPDDWWLNPPLYVRVRLRFAQGKPREALQDLSALGELAAKAGLQPGSFSALPDVALALHAVGDLAEARAVAKQELVDARDWGLPRRTGIALRTLGLIEGGERGLDLLRESLNVLDPASDGLEHMRSLAEYGAALRRANRRAEAREPLRCALETARRAGALAIARRAHEELEATGETLRPLLTGGIESLTASERRVAALAAEGRTNREIAQSLFLSVKTVEGHLSHAYRKLDVTSRGELRDALDGQSAMQTVGQATRRRVVPRAKR